MNIERPTKENHTSEHLEQAIINSALWAAAGDALGWITELAHGETGVKYRTGSTKVKEPIAWQRMIGGRNGPKVNLPAGTYSDDTQLRLAVSRSIRGNGSFDVEAFAKIEITVWPTYALGGGLGTKAAAINLSRRGVNWFSNFYERGTQRYIDGGGNGAAMRIQPHVWSSRGNTEETLLNVMRDSLVTHGHPHGFCGAVFHALVLLDVLKNREIPTPSKWINYAKLFSEIPRIIKKDHQLSSFWLPAWESKSKSTLESGILSAQEEMLQDIETATRLIKNERPADYHCILDELGCLTNRYRGSGLKTSLAALVLSYTHRDSRIEDALVCAANELDSDTDTIATMAGALLGAITTTAPRWPIQDRNYIAREAKRLAEIAKNRPQGSFSYPDLGRWNPPMSQGASIGLSQRGLAIAGLGDLTPQDTEYPAGGAIWQWFTLPFGQTILAKRKTHLEGSIPEDQLPELTMPTADQTKTTQLLEKEAPSQQENLSFDDYHMTSGFPKNNPIFEEKDGSRDPIDIATDEAISSNFDNLTLGRLLNKCIDSKNPIESAIAFASIVAKAKLARQRRNR